MKTLVLIAGMLRSLALLVGLVVAILGLVYLITGRVSLRGYKLRGKDGRKVGLVFLVQFVVAFAVFGLLFEAFGWGSTPGTLDELLTQALATCFASLVLFLGAAGWAWSWALAQARSRQAAAELEEALAEHAGS